MKLFGTGLLALAASGIATASVASGDLDAVEKPIVVASLIIVSSDADRAYPALGGMARSIKLDHSSAETVTPSAHSVPAPHILAQLPDQRSEQVAALGDDQAFFQHRVTGQLSAVPVPVSRPDMSMDAPGDRPATVAPRSTVRQVAPRPTPRATVQSRIAPTPVRIAETEGPRKRSLRLNPIFIGMYR